MPKLNQILDYSLEDKAVFHQKKSQKHLIFSLGFLVTGLYVMSKSAYNNNLISVDLHDIFGEMIIFFGAICNLFGIYIWYKNAKKSTQNEFSFIHILVFHILIGIITGFIGFHFVSVYTGMGNGYLVYLIRELF